MAKIGSSIKRREDPALLTGKGKYTDDLKMRGMLHAVIVRSPHAHARIRSIDTSAAEASPGAPHRAPVAAVRRPRVIPPSLRVA